MQMKIIQIQIHFGPIIKARGSSIPSKGQIVFKPSQTRMLTGRLNNEELILRQVQPTQGKSGTQDQLENCEGLSPRKDILNFNLSAFGIGYEQFSLQKGLLFLFHCAKIDRQQIWPSMIFLANLAGIGACPGPTMKAFSGLGPDAE